MDVVQIEYANLCYKICFSIVIYLLYTYIYGRLYLVVRYGFSSCRAWDSQTFDDTSLGSEEGRDGISAPESEVGEFFQALNNCRKLSNFVEILATFIRFLRCHGQSRKSLAQVHPFCEN